ncbi:hypothetical protein RJD24_07535 [Bacillaceae bacterium IKA-2]|nr:hypothetical protein RJD24_07535 [Bacillaceae bacterium IKA-2]
MSMVAFIMGISFILIHVFANEIIPSNKIQRLKWFSFSGGLAVSYVFVYVLPTLHKEQMLVKDYGDFLAMESELYFIGLIGLLIFYALQKYARKTQLNITKNKPSKVFWLQIIFFSIYNMLVAYTIISHDVSGVQAVFYGLAVGLHFVAVAHDLWREFGAIYNKVGRYVLTLGIILGWLLGVAFKLSALTESVIFAFIAGAMILNVLKYELPPDSEAHFGMFAFGVVSYTSITMSLKFFFQW